MQTRSQWLGSSAWMQVSFIITEFGISLTMFFDSITSSSVTSREYYWCDNGRISDTTHDCGENLLFDSELELCNFADQVVCNNMNSGDTVGQAISPPPPAPIPPTPSPVSKKQPDVSSNTAGALDDKEWPASTTAPSSSNEETVAEENDEDLPPWLAHVVKDAEADSSARTVLSGYHLFEWLLAFSAVVHYVAC